MGYNHHRDWFSIGIISFLGLIVATAIVFIVGVSAFGWFSGPSCDYPYHQVYTGATYQLEGKVWVWVDNYNCVHN